MYKKRDEIHQEIIIKNKKIIFFIINKNINLLLKK
jgi:hypothetical protein